MPYRFLDDAPTADVGFIACGDTIEGCFRAAADATLAAMLGNPDAVRPHQQRILRSENDNLDLLLLNFLEELIYYKDAESLFLRVTSLAVTESGARWIVDATAAGETIDPTRHQLSADVKAVTVHRLGVRRTNSGWEATVVLDV